MRQWLIVLGLCGCLLMPMVNGTSGPPAKTKKETGLASWYGKQHHGRTTASGEPFSRHRLTAAHRSLPLGTKVKVTNLRNRKQVIVKITDRGPYADRKRRIIDLSEAAAARLGMRDQGLELVQIVVVENAS